MEYWNPVSGHPNALDGQPASARSAGRWIACAAVALTATFFPSDDGGGGYASERLHRSRPTLSLPGPRVFAGHGPAIRHPTEWTADRKWSARQRVDGARQRRLDSVRELFHAAGLAYPPQRLLLVAFKREKLLEVWAAGHKGESMRRVTTYSICTLSGEEGPKRRQGDLQVPEGYYEIDSMNPQSQFHLSMRVDYPNASDRIRSDRNSPGGAIMIHGGCASIGCLAMSDERIEELWLMASDSGNRVLTYIFPTKELQQLVSRSSSPNQEFWRNLQEGYALFLKTRQPLEVRVVKDGTYRY